MNSSLADRLSQAKISELIGSVVEEGDVYRMRLDGREGVVGKDGADSCRGRGCILTRLFLKLESRNTTSCYPVIMTFWKVQTGM